MRMPRTRGGRRSMITRFAKPLYRTLTWSEAETVLARNHVGRLAFTLRDRVDIEPISYVYHDGWLYGRTSAGTKLFTVTQQRMVAFEVDEVVDATDWRSVVVKGPFEALRPELGAEPWLIQHATDVLRDAAPAALRSDDPTPSRVVPFRIHPDEMTGREAHPS
jgi:nitroimidazol reductase NimA-like FMN-containing flavoprotein (pyridoxamine 5'-phosphate oxidase superfamily)